MKKRIIVFAPHQDDEVLHCAGVLWQAAQENHDIRICYLTNGEYEGEQFAQIRRNESLAVLQQCKLSPDNAIFLGYADTGMAWEESFLAKLWEAGSARSRWGRTHTWQPDGFAEYHMQRFGSHGAYTKQTIMQDISTLLKELAPDEIYVTASFDKHGDHAAAALLVKQAAQQAAPQAEIFEYLVHTAAEEAWPPRQGAYMRPDDPDVPWERHEIRPLPTGFSAEHKYKLLQQYASQHPEAYNGFLLAFAKNEEIVFHQ